LVESTIYLERISFQPGPIGEGPFLIVHAVEDINLVSYSNSSVYNFPGTIVAELSSQVSFIGSFHIFGSLNITSSSVNITGINGETPTIIFDGSVFVGAVGQTAFLRLFAGVFTTPLLFIAAGSTVEIPLENGTYTIAGDLVNGGIILHLATNNLYITGNFTQLESGELHILNISSGNSFVPIYSQGHGNLAGLIKYRIAHTSSNSSRYPILEAEQNITGTFNRKAESLLGSTTLEPEYSERTVYLQPIPETNDDGGGFKWWYYVIIAGGVAIIAIIIIVVVVRRNRAGYDTVR